MIGEHGLAIIRVTVWWALMMKNILMFCKASLSVKITSQTLWTGEELRGWLWWSHKGDRKQQKVGLGWSGGRMLVICLQLQTKQLMAWYLPCNILALLACPVLKKPSGGYADLPFVAEMTKHEWTQQQVVVGSNGVDTSRMCSYLYYICKYQQWGKHKEM